ncbi:3'-to-5' oligoribonuclease B [Campylobacter sp. MIT 12-5580]|uniref:DHH family phosphoesterase n=1 Tax=Campylobacter sp. MIT 12-5580 TaxID=2040651 RepID=UPI0010F4D9A2|nr:3'-to-5' oligoribonuclease B [Campylobacter sp. MIT 12-5580]TKX28320.1 3'-to-5' oligoribonuclease B [Campylobacter sp. MIT 12-5580]
MRLYHLSHTDLDGYACQFVTHFYFKDCVFYNSNYGKEISDNFYAILSEINASLEQDSNAKSMVLISDLNLTLAQCEEFQDALKDKNAKLILLDHHQSGLECMKEFAWYVMDEKRSASQIVYDFFTRICTPNESLKRFVSVVNAIDIWLKDEKDFELGKVFLSMIATAKELNRVMFREQNTEYMFFLLSKAKTFIDKDQAHIALEDALHFLKKEYFRKDKNDTLINLICAFVVELLSKKKEEFCIYYENHKGILTSNIGNTSVIGNDFLVKNPDFDFFIDVSSKKTLSFRANGKVDVSIMAKKLVGGGGHKNASGGLFAAFKESVNYALIKAQIQDLIISKTQI